MLAVLGAIGSLVIASLLIVLAVLLVAVVFLAVLAALAGSMTDWGALRRRLSRRRAPLALKLSGSAVPQRLRAELTGRTPRLRRRFVLGDGPPRAPHRIAGESRFGFRRHRGLARRSRI
ncbi:hypothetical protein [Nonomuraea sp. NPDC002799]